MTPRLAVTETPDWGALPWGWITLFALAASVVYACACWWRPFAHCHCCSGTGRHYNKKRTTFRDCWWCDHTGRRLRLGRKVYNAFNTVRRDAS